MLIKHVLSHFTKFVKTRFLAQKSGSQFRCRTMLKKTWYTQKTPIKHVLRLLKNFLKIWFSAKKIRFSAQMSNNAKNTLKHPENTNKHVLRLFEKFLKIRFSAQTFGSRLRCRTMLKYLETLRKHQLIMCWDFLRNFWKSGSRLKNPDLGSDVEQC